VLTFEEAAFGTEKRVDVPSIETCSRCNGLRAEPGTEPERCKNCDGTGEVRRVQQSIFGQFVNVSACDRCGGEGRYVSRPCKSCRGSGHERRTRTLEIKVPAGVDDGSQMRLSGEGEVGRYGGPRGNLYLHINVQQHPLFQRDGDDLIYNLELNIAQAALGSEVEVPTLEEPQVLRIAPGTQGGELFVMKGKGVPHLRKNGRGDLLVHIQVTTPQNLNHEQKAILAQLANSLGTPVEDEKGFLGRVKDAFT
jgi:molecular chaperone DnaJ